MRRNNSIAGATVRKARARWVLAWAVLGLLLAVVLAPLPFYLLSGKAVAQGGAPGEETNVRAEFWREGRQGTPGYTAVTGQEANVLIQNGGENWRVLRNGPLITYGAWMMGGFLAIVAAFYLMRGAVKIDGGRSGLTVQRWNAFERVLHWYTAILFIALAITGLSLLYGRMVLIPVLGKDGFAAYASLAKTVHNYLGPAFALGLLVEILIWIRHNLPNRDDLAWLAKGGGMIGKGHASAGRMNAGEKIWFWLLCTVGVAMVLAGFVLDFPNFGQTRDQMQLAHLVHVVGGFILITVAFGHIYIGTLGTEGAFEAMATGRVDVEWAKQHHDLWYQELVAKGVMPEPAGTGQGQPPPAVGVGAEARSA
jgi:formate dehydrogenase subunit gamma